MVNGHHCEHCYLILIFSRHKELEQAQECPEYVLSGGFRSGCNFTGKSLPAFTNINFCLNGSFHEEPLKPTFISLQTQNQGNVCIVECHHYDSWVRVWWRLNIIPTIYDLTVKPGTTEKLHVQEGPDASLKMQWEQPAGGVPGHCLEWEVEHTQEGPDEKIASVAISYITLSLLNKHFAKKGCFSSEINITGVLTDVEGIAAVENIKLLPYWRIKSNKTSSKLQHLSCTGASYHSFIT